VRSWRGETPTGPRCEKKKSKGEKSKNSKQQVEEGQGSHNMPTLEPNAKSGGGPLPGKDKFDNRGSGFPKPGNARKRDRCPKQK